MTKLEFPNIKLKNEMIIHMKNNVSAYNLTAYKIEL